MKFTILGGDLRSAYLARRLLQDGHSVGTYGLELTELTEPCRCGSLREALEGTDCVVLPIPTAEGQLLRTPYGCTPIDLEELTRALPCHVPVFGAGRCGIDMVDLPTVESMAIANGELTAQCALRLILEQLPDRLMGKRVLILGAGRIGTLLGLKLRALGASVTVTARREDDKAWCAALGLNVGDTRTLGPLLPESDILINTVPAPVLGEDALALLPRHALLMELASMPGGFDPTAAERQGIRTVMGRGLPGKYAPKAAADIIAHTIYNVLEM